MRLRISDTLYARRTCHLFSIPSSPFSNKAGWVFRVNCSGIVSNLTESKINALNASLRSLIAAVSTYIASSQCSQQPTVLCGFWMCISIVDWNKSVPQFLGVWPLTFRGHLRSKIFSPFESPYMTAYLTFTYTFSLSHTVYEIFYFKVFRLWPWFLKVKNIFTIRKPIPHTWLPTQLPLTLSFIPFLRYLTSKFSGFDLDL